MSRRDDFRDIAKSVPFDNSSNGFTSTDVQGAIEELKSNAAVSASPGFSFGRSGVSTAGTYLQNETVPSNISGRWVYIQNAAVTHVFVSNELTTTYTIEILYHDGNGIGLTSLGTVTVTTAKGEDFPVNWPVPHNKQIAVRIATTTANSPKNVVCGLQLTGTTV
jgi:hypothetical protein